jgi:hypothetical protein
MLLVDGGKVKEAVMGRLKVFRKSCSLKRKLILGLTVLMLLVLIPVLSINILATSPAGVPENNADVGETSALVGDTGGEEIPTLQNATVEERTMESFGTPLRGLVDWRDPEIAAKYGVPGYVEFLMDSPRELALSRGEEWSVTMLAHFVSYSSELTEVQLNIYPHGKDGLGGLSSGRLAEGGVIVGMDYAGGFFDFTDLIDYSPSGAIVIGEGEALSIEMTIRIPEDFPETIEVASLGGLLGIWSNTPGIRFVVDSVVRQVIVR